MQYNSKWLISPWGLGTNLIYFISCLYHMFVLCHYNKQIQQQQQHTPRLDSMPYRKQCFACCLFPLLFAMIGTRCFSLKKIIITFLSLTIWFLAYESCTSLHKPHITIRDTKHKNVSGFFLKDRQSYRMVTAVSNIEWGHTISFSHVIWATMTTDPGHSPEKCALTITFIYPQCLVYTFISHSYYRYFSFTDNIYIAILTSQWMKNTDFY